MHPGEVGTEEGERDSAKSFAVPSYCAYHVFLGQRQQKGQQQQGAPSQELSAWRTENGEKEMSVSINALTEGSAMKAVKQSP